MVSYNQGMIWLTLQAEGTTHPRTVAYSHKSQWEKINLSGVGSRLYICFQPFC